MTRPLSQHPAAVRAREWRSQHPDRAFSRNLVTRAKKWGELFPGPCALKDETCKGRIEAHHEQYGRGHSLEVTWLCRSHHLRVDAHKRRQPTDACGRCGGAWSVAKSGKRYCRPCAAQRMRRSREARRAS